MLIFNILVPLLEGIFKGVYDGIIATSRKRPENEVWVILYLIAENVTAILQTMSGVFLLYAVYMIRKFLKKGIKSEQINERTLALHAFAFGLYMISNVVYYVFQMIDIFNDSYINFNEIWTGLFV